MNEQILSARHTALTTTQYTQNEEEEVEATARFRWLARMRLCVRVFQRIQYG